MKEQFKKLMHPKEFLIRVAFKLNVERDTMRVYIESGKVPAKHQKYVAAALELQMQLDEKISKMQVIAFEKL